MRSFFLFFALCIGLSLYSQSEITLQLEDNLFFRIPIPRKGIVCSNQLRVDRLSHYLENVFCYESAWGPRIYIGEYQGEKIFVASAPVGAGSGLVFTELYAGGAEYIVRYGSDDVPNPTLRDFQVIKVIDETDNLYGFNKASGVPSEEWGKSLFASSCLIAALEEEAIARGLMIERRVCHHLENYYAIRCPEKYPNRTTVLREQITALARPDRPESWDMESAILFRVAHDFNKHAAAVLQMVNKEDSKMGPYEGKNREKALEQERLFFNYVCSTLLRL